MLMRTSSEGPGPARGDRAKAWSFLVTNLLVLPGLGSVMAGFRSGYLQIILALLGFALTLGFIIHIALAWGREFQLPEDPLPYRGAIVGMAIFLVSWLWSLLVSLRFFREKK
jgi:hypothetical protein